MSRKYEALIVVDTKGKEQSVQEFQKVLGKELEDSGAKLTDSNHLGRKTFAYNARKLDGAHYFSYQFDAPADTIEKVKTKLALNSDVYMQYYQRLD